MVEVKISVQSSSRCKLPTGRDWIHISMREFIHLAKLAEGDQVAVISPSAGLPGLFPWVQDLGLARVRDVFGLHPVEYPTTRTMGASPADRARDVMAAFSDPKNKAVLTSIGGDDEIKLLKYLDPDVIRRNAKPFLGYSDNTHLHNFLWRLGIPSYYGGSILTQFAMQGSMDEFTVKFLKHALFDSGEYELEVAEEYNDEGLDWDDEANLAKTRKLEPNDGLVWDNPDDVEGILWGGCLESLILQSAAARYLPTDGELDGTILFLETAEDIPEPWIVQDLLTGFGERGWFDRFQAVLVGRAKAWEFDKPKSPPEKAAYRLSQRETVVRVVREYNPVIPIAQNLDFGHTDPQIVLPMGSTARLTSDRRIFLTY
jgi:muramoyltetrapeptide carboxypeptidase LdcA involved in peptidoglycan recycling